MAAAITRQRRSWSGRRYPARYPVDHNKLNNSTTSRSRRAKACVAEKKKSKTKSSDASDLVRTVDARADRSPCALTTITPISLVRFGRI